VQREDGGSRAARCDGECRARGVVVDHTTSAWRTRWQEWEHHWVSRDGGGRSGSATRKQHGRGSRSRGTNCVVVEPVSVEAIDGDELD